MARTTQRKRRRRARESSAKLASSSESEGGLSSEDDREEAEEQERRWQTRRSAHDNKGKGKELVREEDDVESRSSESDEEEDEEEEEQLQPQPRDGPQQTLDQICGICLSEGGNERGKLDCCEHFFCFACIMEWAKVESRCPMCKQRFLTVMRPAVSGVSRSRNRSFRIPTRDQVYEPSEEEIRLFTDPYQNTVCTECQEAGDEGLLLLCDRCDAAAHTYCVGLGRSVPRGDWFCQACQVLERESSGEDDEEDTTFDSIDVDEEEGSGTESILAMLVADIQPNLFAGRTRRSAAAQGPAPLRRSTRRRMRRRSLSNNSPRLSEALINMSSSPRRGFFPSLMESYAARTLYHQRRVQATVQNRLQNMRENWNRYRSGELDFTTAGHSVESSRPGSANGDLPSSSNPRLGDTGRSTSATAMDVDGGGVPASSQMTRGAGRAAESAQIDRAWANMDRAIRLEGSTAGASHPAAVSQVGSASDRKNREIKLQETPVSARTRERYQQGDVNARANSSRGPPTERYSEGGAHSRATRDERHSQGDVVTKPNSTRGGLDIFNTRNSNSRDSDVRESHREDMTVREDKPPENSSMEILSGGDSSRGGYHLRETNRQLFSRTGSNTKDNAATVGRVMSPTSRENKIDNEVLQVRSILDDKDNSRGSGGVSTRRREAKERQCLQVPSILDDKDNSRGSMGVTTRNREAKAAQSLLGKSILEDKDNSRGSTGPITRRETDRNRLQPFPQGMDQSVSRNPTRDAEMKLMKEQCCNLVQIALKPILQKGTIDKYQYKELARSATHTILSSLGVPGLKHGTDVVSMGTVTCYHEEPTSSSLIPGCCNSCVQRHVTRYVKSLVKDKIDLHK